MARSSGYLDWATQPNPFRTFDGCDTVDLVAALEASRSDPSGWPTRPYDSLFAGDVGTPMFPGLPAVSVFLRYSLGLSAWKQDPWSRWPLRVNPSSGNLHPTEGYVLLPPGAIDPGATVCHYRPDLHALERRAVVPEPDWCLLAEGLPSGSFFAALTSITWREAWKYGERAFRYCQHDTGHAIAAMRIAGAMIGWRVRLVSGGSSSDLGALLGTSRDQDFRAGEAEEPECLLVVTPARVPEAWQPDTRAPARAVAASAWHGRANQLSADRVVWDAIDDVAGATRDAASRPTGVSAHEPVPVPHRCPIAGVRPVPASRLLLQRRSAAAMTGEGHLDLDAFCLLLRRLLPDGHPPWDAPWWTPRVHLALFVHRIRGLDPGLYLFARTEGALPLLRATMRDDFVWVRPRAVPDDLPLYLLAPLDVRRVAGTLSCSQAIAADGFFSAGMLAEFDGALDDYGASFYRCLFWEAGLVGHMLYLEAEAAGARGTGIGCYFDDAVHDLLGITGHRLQSLYHFTVGQPVDDTRLQTEPGYAWEGKP